MSEFVDTGEEWIEYLNRMAKDKEWASHLELIAVGNSIGAPILVTTDCRNDEHFQVWVYPSTKQTDLVILLGYSQDHYYSLEGIIDYHA
jgi:hypothetical protein